MRKFTLGQLFDKMDWHIEQCMYGRLPEELKYHRRRATYWLKKAKERYEQITS